VIETSIFSRDLRPVEPAGSTGHGRGKFRALPFPCFFSIRSKYLRPGTFQRRNRVAASEKVSLATPTAGWNGKPRRDAANRLKQAAIRPRSR